MTGRLEDTFQRIDEANALDPSTTPVDGKPIPNELLYGQRMSAWLDRFKPDAADVLKIACRAQHLERWKLPRSSYPQTKQGYHAWRNEQKRRHGERVSEMMVMSGYSEDEAERTASLVRKERLKSDPETQALEDVACLVFLQHYAVEFAADKPEEQMVDIFRKTWRKMSQAGQKTALSLDLHPKLAVLVEKALTQ